ncbi:MAG: hypothetical protein D6788_08055, partial [Planctomycetota bacterium]
MDAKTPHPNRCAFQGHGPAENEPVQEAGGTFRSRALTPRSPSASAHDEMRFTPWVIGVVALCLLPWLLHGMGWDAAFDYSSASSFASPSGGAETAGLVRAHAVHAILEWTGVCAAMLVGALGLVSYRLTRDPVLPVLGMALAVAAVPDAYSALADAGILRRTFEGSDVIPLGWTACRLLNGIVLVFGVGFLYVARRVPRTLSHVVFTLPMVMVVTFVAFVATEPNATVNRVWPVRPDLVVMPGPFEFSVLLLYVCAGVGYFVLFWRMHRSPMTGALALSIVPHIAAQLYMAFGSARPFDAMFNAAYWLKATAYAVPLLGITQDYVRAFRRQRQVEENLVHQTEELRCRTVALEFARARLGAAVRFAETLNQHRETDVYRDAVNVLAEELHLSFAALYVFDGGAARPYA